MSTSKVCSTCNTEKPYSEFHKAKGYRAGYTGQCKACRYVKMAEWAKSHPDNRKATYKRLNQKDERRAKNREYAQERRDNGKAPEYMSEYRQIHHDKILQQARDGNLRNKYGLTPEQFHSMLAAQDGVCSICKQPDKQGIRLAVDHNHDTGEVRGLLCGNCNKAIGLMRDSPAILFRAIEYLNSY